MMLARLDIHDMRFGDVLRSVTAPCRLLDQWQLEKLALAGQKYELFRSPAFTSGSKRTGMTDEVIAIENATHL